MITEKQKLVLDFIAKYPQKSIIDGAVHYNMRAVEYIKAVLCGTLDVV